MKREPITGEQLLDALQKAAAETPNALKEPVYMSYDGGMVASPVMEER